MAGARAWGLLPHVPALHRRVADRTCGVHGRRPDGARLLVRPRGPAHDAVPAAPGAGGSGRHRHEVLLLLGPRTDRQSRRARQVPVRRRRDRRRERPGQHRDLAADARPLVDARDHLLLPAAPAVGGALVRAAVRIVLACALGCATTGCFRTVYRELEPPGTMPPAGTPARHSSPVRSFFLYGWVPRERVVQAAAECGGA